MTWRWRLTEAVGLRLALWYAAVFAVSAIAVGLIGYQLLVTSLVNRDHELLRARLEELSERYELGGVRALSDAIAAEPAAGELESVLVRLLSPTAEVLLVSRPPVWSTFDLGELDRQTTGGDALNALSSRNAPTRLEVATRRLADGTLMQVGRTTVGRDRFLGEVRDVIGVLTVVTLVTGLAGGFALTREALRPLRALVATVRRIAQTGELHQRVTAGPAGDLVDELGRVFNTMLVRIETLVDGMRGALDGVAHDLRTPIARLRAHAESALAKQDDPEAAAAALATCVEEADRVMALLTTLLDISEAQTGTMRLTLEPVRVGDLIDETVDLYEDVADERGVTLESSAAPAVAVQADRQRLRQVLANLVDNALKYTPRGGRVTVVGAARPGEVVLEVRDTGAGIPAAELPRIWERLYRADWSRAEPGLGLGLSLVKAVVVAHGGRVEVESEIDRGSTFRVILPGVRA
jgi:signal transduction histidine kinase